MSRIEGTITKNRANNRRSIMTYLNCGDPDINTTEKLIKLCHHNGIDIIELGVPFPNSFTDGEVVKKSHQRALASNVTFEATLKLVKKLRAEKCSIPIVLLVDFSHTVKPRGITTIVDQSSASGADGLLIHGLPPLYTHEYLQAAKNADIDTIFSLYPNSPEDTVNATLSNSRGFIYLVSQYGRTGSVIDFRSDKIKNFYALVKRNTQTPLLAGFGIKNTTDIETLFTYTDIDGVILGSAICKLIEANTTSENDLLEAVSNYIQSIEVKKSIGYSSHKEHKHAS